MSDGRFVTLHLYRCIFRNFVPVRKAWSLTLREECRPSVFEIRVLRRICGSERDEVAGEWRRLNNEELYALMAHQILG